MSVIMTAAGEALKARLQAEGKPLVIDTFVFAHIPNLDPTEQLTPGITVPTEQVVYAYPIPDEDRAYGNPNQVGYSALLGSDVGDWSFNWQGLVCSEYDTLIAAATFPTLEKRKYSGATGAAGNNLTRNFLLEFSGAKELTGITISADVWQLDFTIRLLGMDERERLSNFALYVWRGRAGSTPTRRDSAMSAAYAPSLPNPCPWWPRSRPRTSGLTSA